MEISRENFRAMIFYDYKCNLPKQCINRFHLGMKHHPIGVFIIGLPNSNMEHTILSDEFREDRPSASVVATNVDVVREMIERDRHITYQEIQTSLGSDMKVTHTILHDHLSV